MSEENKALARRSWELLENPGVLEEVYAPDLVWHEPDRDIRGSEEAKRFLGAYKTAFPDLHATVEDVIAEGDRVVVHVTGRGPDRGEFHGIPPPGRTVTATRIGIGRRQGGRIAEAWAAYDALGLLQQLGALPPPLAAPGGARSSGERA